MHVRVYSRSIFRIPNSEYAFHFICVFFVNFQKHATSYSDACFWKSTENTNIKVECLFWILNSEHWLKIQIYWLARIAWICKFTSFQISRCQFSIDWISDRVVCTVATVESLLVFHIQVQTNCMREAGRQARRAAGCLRPPRRQRRPTRPLCYMWHHI